MIMIFYFLDEIQERVLATELREKQTDEAKISSIMSSLNKTRVFKALRAYRDTLSGRKKKKVTRFNYN